MQRFAISAVLCFCALALVTPLRAQDAAPDDKPAPETINEVVAAVYATISGPAGERDWAFFRTLFTEDAKMMAMRRTPEGESVGRPMSVDDYIERAGAFFGENPFYEREIARTGEMFGSVAHCFSTYASYRDPDGEPFDRGINSIQLARFGTTWKVVSIVWDSESPTNPIPAKYLPE